jgi:hypothetical protein
MILANGFCKLKAAQELETTSPARAKKCIDFNNFSKSSSYINGGSYSDVLTLKCNPSATMGLTEYKV